MKEKTMNKPDYRFIGKPIRRAEDERLITGRGQFSDDFVFDGQTYAAIVRSPYPHARIRGIDSSKARAIKGVLGRDLPANDERADYMRATLKRRDDGTWEATPFPVQDSSMLVPLAASDCLVVRAPFAPAAEVGSPCEFLRLDD